MITTPSSYISLYTVTYISFSFWGTYFIVCVLIIFITAIRVIEVSKWIISVVDILSISIIMLAFIIIFCFNIANNYFYGKLIETGMKSDEIHKLIDNKSLDLKYKI